MTELKRNKQSNMKRVFYLIITLTLSISSYSQTAIEYYKRGNAKEKLQDYTGAIADYTKAIELNPKDPSAYYNRGLAKIDLSQKDSGCLDLSKAGEWGAERAYEMIKKYCQ